MARARLALALMAAMLAGAAPLPAAAAPVAPPAVHGVGSSAGARVVAARMDRMPTGAWAVMVPAFVLAAPVDGSASPVVALPVPAGGSALRVAAPPAQADRATLLVAQAHGAPLPVHADGSVLPAQAADTLPDPAPEPPAPAVLSDRPAPRAPAAGFAPLPGLPAPEAGGFRWTGAPPGREVLRRLGAALAEHPGRIIVEVEVAGPEADASAARRASLARAQVVRDALVEGGRDPRRIDLRPMGRGAAGRDRISVLPGGAGP